MASETPTVLAEKRDQLGSRYTRRLRKSGQLPMVIYGHKEEPLHVQTNALQMTKTLHSHAHLLNLECDGTPQPVIVKSVQWDHMGSNIIHVDLERVDPNEQITVSVDIKFSGEPIGLKTPNTYVDHPMESLEITCLASNIPDFMTFDISDLQAESHYSISDLTFPQGVVPTLGSNVSVVAVKLSKRAVSDADADAVAEEEA